MAALDTVFQFAGVAAEAFIIILVVYRRVYRTLPIFCAYLAWSLISDLGSFLLIRHFPDRSASIYLASAIIDSIFMLCVLIEVSMSVLKPVREWLPRWVIPVLGLAITAVAAIVWQFIRFPGFNDLPAAFQRIAHVQMTISAVRVLFFLVLACCSQLLSIGWRDRELQIATGFGFYSVVSLSVSLIHINQGVGTPELSHQYHLLDTATGVSFLCSLIYWSICFIQKVPERREFTPQMQNFLVALAGNARTARIAMDSKSPMRHGRNRDR